MSSNPCGGNERCGFCGKEYIEGSEETPMIRGSSNALVCFSCVAYLKEVKSTLLPERPDDTQRAD